MAANNQNNDTQKKRGPGRPPGSKNKSKSSSGSSGSKSSKKQALTAEEARLEKIREMQAQYDHERRNLDVIWSITLFAFGLFLFFTVVMDTTGSFGRTVHDICLGLFGSMAYVLPFFVLIFAVLLLARKMQHVGGRTAFFSILIFINMCMLNSARFIDEKMPLFGLTDMIQYYEDGVNKVGGGFFGMELGSIVVKLFGMPGLYIISTAVILISVFLVANTPISRFFDNMVLKHEQRRIVREFEEAEAAKVQMAVARSATPGADPETGIVKNGVQPEVKESPIAGGAKSLWRSILSGITKIDDDPETVPSQRDQYAASKRIAPGEEVVQPLDAPEHRITNLTDESQIDYTRVLGKDTLFDRPSDRVAGPSNAVQNEGDRPVVMDMNFEGVDDGDFGYRGKTAQRVQTTPEKPRGMGGEPFKGKAGKQYGLGDPDEYGHSGGYGLDGRRTSSAGRGLDSGVAAAANEAAGTESVMQREMKAFNVAGSGLDGSYDAENAHRKKHAGISVESGKGLGEEEQVEAAKRTKGKKGLDDEKPQRSAEDDELAESFNQNSEDASYVLPAPELLKKPVVNKQMASDYQLEQKAELLEKTLNDFGVDAKVLTVTQGASVTRYEVQPATGVKVSSITRLADDIALNLRAKNLRIEAPIPGKAAVGIEVENDKPSPVLVRELIESEEFKKSSSKITFVVGKDISGNNIIADLKGMPHLLIAGATGSGKSVCINTIITSFLYKAKPSELRLIMIDPKVVELANYNGIPHLLTPVVTDARKASRALAIAVEEMDKRYELFAKEGVKDLESYNELMKANHEFASCKPQVVIIIDELADLMMAAPSEVENSICRLAQKARAAGMHLIVATQRPSVDVVTGLIKANIPSRIAFSVASQVDSRTILDMAGAEKLLGKGDMLFSPVGSSKPYRVQGPYISDSEIDKVIKFVKKEGGGPVYDEELKNAIENADKRGSSEPQDELTEDAIAFILKSKQASVSMLQRRFRIGYNRAARIIDEIEEKGIIGPSDGSRPRQVLVTEDEYYNGGANAAAAQDTIDEISPQEKAELEAKVTGKPHMNLMGSRPSAPQQAPSVSAGTQQAHNMSAGTQQAPHRPAPMPEPEPEDFYGNSRGSSQAPAGDTADVYDDSYGSRYEEPSAGEETVIAPTGNDAVDYFNSLPESVRKMILNSDE